MRLSRRMLALVAAGCSITVVAAAQATGFHGVKPVPGKALGTAVPLMPGGGLKAVAVAQGSTRLGGATSANPHYGYDGDGPMLPPPGAVQSPGHNVEATKTEPDKNTYLVLTAAKGPAKGSLFRYAIKEDEKGHLIVNRDKQFDEKQWDDPAAFVKG